MFGPSTFGDITHAIQLAVAPVFLLAGVNTLLAVLTNRLSRSVDRRRVLANILSQADHGLERQLADLASGELKTIERRIRLIYVAILLDVSCTLLICVLIALAFVDSLVAWNFSRSIATLFVLAMLALIGSVSVFMQEIFLAVNAPRSPIR